MKPTAAFILTLIIFAGCSTSSHYSSMTKQEVESRVLDNISAKQIVIDVNRALPTQGRSTALTGSYGLKIIGDSVYSYLPYFGRAYSLPYGGGEGLIFEGVAEGFTVKPAKKDENEISFRVRTREDSYAFDVSVWTNGSATIMVNPNNKQRISYMGQMRMEP